MWPWDHLAVAYVAYSLLRRATGRTPPSPAAVAFVVLGSQLPDLIDKPLGWYLGVLPSGTSLAHSLVFAVPLCLAVLAWRARRGTLDQGVAFSVAYLLHLPADAYYPTLLGAEAKAWILLWPILPGEHAAPADVSGHLAALIARFAEAATGPGGVYLVAVEAVLLGSAALLWYVDGLPGLPVGRLRSGNERPGPDG